MKHLGTVVIETERLVLRPFTINDAEKMYENWASDDEVTKYLTWPTHENVEGTKGILETWIEKYKESDFYLWAITLKEYGDDPIGSISVVRQEDDVEMVCIGYCLGKKWWQQGIMPEAFSELIRFFFEEVKVNRIESWFDTRNPASGRVMEKSGLKYEGIMREADWNNQGRCDMVVYAILARDYKDLKTLGLGVG